jgi:hypothetical protein
VAPGLLDIIRLGINYIASLPDGEGEREGDAGEGGREERMQADWHMFVCVYMYIDPQKCMLANKT